MPVEILSANPIELQQPSLGKTPEAFYPIDVASLSIRISVSVMVDAMVLIAIEYQPIIGSPFVRVDRTPRSNESANDRANLGTARVLDDLSIDLSMAFEQTKHRGFSGAASAVAFVLSAEVTLIEFDLSSKAVSLGLLLLVDCDPFPKEPVVTIDGVAVNSQQASRLSGREIFTKAPQKFFPPLLAQFAILDQHSRPVYHISSSLEPT